MTVGRSGDGRSTAELNFRYGRSLTIAQDVWIAPVFFVLRCPIWKLHMPDLWTNCVIYGERDPVRAASAYLFRDDLLAALQYTTARPEIDADAIGVLGHSLGGLGTILAVTEGIPVSAVITDSMPSQFEVIVSSELRRRRLPLFPLAQLIPRIWLGVWVNL